MSVLFMGFNHTHHTNNFTCVLNGVVGWCDGAG